MSRMSDLAIDIQCALEDGELSFAEIAAIYEVPITWVVEVAESLLIDELHNLQK